MNTKQLKIIAIVLAVAVLLYLPRLFRTDGSGGTVDTGDGFAVMIDDAIERIDVVPAGGGEPQRLEQAADGWMIDGYTADQIKVDDLLAVIGNLSASELIARNPANHAGMGVGDDGRRIDVFAGGAETSFYLGDRDNRGGGYFVRLPGDDAVFRLDGPAGGYLSRERDGWRPRQIAAVDTAGVREIVIRRDDGEAVVRRAEAGWTVGDAPADSAAVAGLLAMLPNLSLTSFPTREEEDAADFSLANASIDVFSDDDADVTGRRLVLSLRLLSDEDRGDWLVQRADASEAYRLAEFSVNRLLPEALIP